MKLTQLLSAGAVFAHLQVRDKKQAFKQLAVYAASLTNLGEREVYSTLMEREYANCTGMGKGVCIPHGRFEYLDRPYALFARLDSPIEFGAADGGKVDLIFLLLSPAATNTEHLKALSLISKLLRDKVLCAKLRAEHNPNELYNLLLTASVDDG